MRTIRVAATAVTLGLLVTTGALAQTEDRPSTMPSTTTSTSTRTTDSGSTISGKVTNVNVSGRSFTVESPTGAMTFQTNTSTHIMTAMTGSQTGTGSSGTMGTGMTGTTTTGSMGTLSNLKVGDEVRVAYSGPASGTPTATQVEVLSPGTLSGSTGTTGSTYGTTGTPGTGTMGTSGTMGTTGTTGTMGSSTYGTTGTTTTTGTSLTGKVVTVDPMANTITVETSSGRETLHADASSRFLSSGRSVVLRDLHEGDTVVLTFTGTGDDRVIARGEVTQGSYAARSTTTTTTSPPSSTYGSTTTMDEDDADLPSTASPIPAFLAAGLLLLATGLALRRLRRRA